MFQGEGTAATGAPVFANATCILVRIFLEVRTLFPAEVHLVSTFIVVSAGPAAPPTSIRHVLVLSYAVRGGLWCGDIVGDLYASPSVVDQLVSFFRLLHIPLVVHAGQGP